MKLYLISERKPDGQQYFWLYFFLSSALKYADILTDAAEWALEKNPSPWRKIVDEAGNIVFLRPGSGHVVEIMPIRLLWFAVSFKRGWKKRLHWQNLNEKGREDVKGSILRAGRAWFKSNGRHTDTGGLEVHWEWHFFSHHKGAEVRLCGGDGDRDIQFFFGCGLLAFWLTFEDAFPLRLKNWIQFGDSLNARIVRAIGTCRHQKWVDGVRDAYQQGITVTELVDFMLKQTYGTEVIDTMERSLFMKRIMELREKGIINLFSAPQDESLWQARIDDVYEANSAYWSRTIGFTLHDKAIWFSLWNPSDWWSSTSPKWWAFTFHYVDFILGKHKYSKRTLDCDTRTLTMPEGAYPVEIELEEATWKRKRWPFATRIVRADIKCPTPIPVPGKGENSWDCGEDATHGMTVKANTFDKALSELYASVMRDRERYGGRNWLPHEKAGV